MKNIILCTIGFFMYVTPIFAADTIDIEVMKIKKSSIARNIDKVGVAEAYLESVISTANEGTIENLYYDEGQRVQKGKIIAKIGTSDFNLLLKTAQANVNQQQLSMKFLSKTYERQKKLFEKNIISLAEFEKIENQYEAQKINLQLAVLNYQQAQNNYKDSIIKAPFNGIFKKKNVELNEFVRKGDVIYILIQDNILKVNFAVNEKELSVFGINKRVEIFFDTHINKKYVGNIKKISSTANVSTKNFTVETSIKNPQYIIRPGVTARIKTNEAAKEKFFIPLSAIIETSRGRVVYIHNNGTSKEVKVVTGEVIGDKIEVRNGLVEGNELIVKGQQFLNAGDSVNIVQP